MPRSLITQSGVRLNLSSIEGLGVHVIKPCGKQFLKLTIIGLTEILPGTGGQGTRVLQYAPSLESQVQDCMEWSEFQQVEPSDTTAVSYLTSSASIQLGVANLATGGRPVMHPGKITLKFTVKIYTSDGIVQTESNQNITVLKDNVYFSYEISGKWPFQSDASKIKLTVRLAGRGGMHHTNSLTLEKDDENDSLQYILCGPGAFLPSSELMKDGVEYPASQVIDPRIHKNLINFYLPQYSSSIRHNILLDMNSTLATSSDLSDPNGSCESPFSTITTQWMYIGMIILFLALCIGLVLWLRSRPLKSSQSNSELISSPIGSDSFLSSNE